MHRLIFPFFAIQVLGQPESIGVCIFFRYVSHTNVEMVDNKLEAQKKKLQEPLSTDPSPYSEKLVGQASKPVGILHGARHRQPLLVRDRFSEVR